MDELSGRLLVVATPIGNLGDLTVRARTALEAADLICCEDTRRTRTLLSALGIPAGGRLVSLREHNERSMAEWVVGRIEHGDEVCYVTDAGTPGVSDPGEVLVRAVVAAGYDVTTLPGPSAAIAALVVSGLPMDRFCVEGFLPRRGSARAARLASLVTEERSAVLFEAPSRLVATLADLETSMATRPCVVCRELTKLHEEVVRGTVADVATTFASMDTVKGELVIVLGGAVPSVPDDETVTRAVCAELARGASVRDAAATVSSALGVSRRRAYDAALLATPDVTS